MFELASRLVGVYKVNHMVCFCGFFLGVFRVLVQMADICGGGFRRRA